MHRLALILTVALLTACSGGENNSATSQSASAPQVNSRKMMPEDPDLKSLYTQSCFSCHGTGAGGAPRTGHAGDWQPRLEKGMDVLLDHTINGFKGMPPLGMCMDCGEEEFTDLINFMAGQ